MGYNDRRVRNGRGSRSRRNGPFTVCGCGSFWKYNDRVRNSDRTLACWECGDVLADILLQNESSHGSSEFSVEQLVGKSKPANVSLVSYAEKARLAVAREKFHEAQKKGDESTLAALKDVYPELAPDAGAKPPKPKTLFQQMQEANQAYMAKKGAVDKAFDAAANLQIAAQAAQDKASRLYVEAQEAEAEFNRVREQYEKSKDADHGTDGAAGADGLSWRDSVKGLENDKDLRELAESLERDEKALVDRREALVTAARAKRAEMPPTKQARVGRASESDDVAMDSTLDATAASADGSGAAAESKDVQPGASSADSTNISSGTDGTDAKQQAFLEARRKVVSSVKAAANAIDPRSKPGQG